MTAAKKRSVSIIAGVVLVILIGLFFVLHFNRVYFRSPIVLLSQPGQMIGNSKVQPVQLLSSNGSFNSLQDVSGGTATDQVSYQQALQTYHTTRLLFDPNCRVTPVTFVVPAKSVVMLDNQSKWQRSVIVGPRQYTIMPYNYVLAVFNTPGAYGITCDSVQDIGFISVQ